MPSPAQRAIYLFLIFSFSVLAYADDIEILPEKQQHCVDKKISKWEKQREKEIERNCDWFERRGEECRTTVGGEYLLRKEALVNITKICKTKFKDE